MSPFENIVDAIHGLSHEEKVQLRLVLDKELEAPASHNEKRLPSSKGIIGLFADEPEVMDRVMEAVYEHRSRPLRLEHERID